MSATCVVFKIYFGLNRKQWQETGCAVPEPKHIFGSKMLTSFDMYEK